MGEEQCRFCFDVLLSHLDGKDLPEWGDEEEESFALFVSWKKGLRQELRGCLGTFTPQPLSKGLSEYAIASATRDSRFTPIHRNEVPDLHVGVSLLESFEWIVDPLDWLPGTHGIVAEFTHGSRRYRATYLPEIAIEQGWSREETLRSLAQKAGLPRGAVFEDLLHSVRVQRYRSVRSTLSYANYLSQHGR